LGTHIGGFEDVTSCGNSILKFEDHIGERKHSKKRRKKQNKHERLEPHASRVSHVAQVHGTMRILLFVSCHTPNLTHGARVVLKKYNGLLYFFYVFGEKSQFSSPNPVENISINTTSSIHKYSFKIAVQQEGKR